MAMRAQFAVWIINFYSTDTTWCSVTRLLFLSHEALLYAVGGYDGASRHCLSTVECYNPESDTWTPVAEMSCRRSGAGNLK